MKYFWLVLLLAAASARLVAVFYWDARVLRTATKSDANSAADANSATNFAADPMSAAEGDVDRDGPFFFGDGDSYWKLGRALAFGRPYRFDSERNWRVFRTPGYPATLAPLFWTFGENPPILAARLQGVAFGTLNVALVGWLAFSIFRRRDVATFSGVFVAFDPTLVFQSVLVLSEESFLTFALLQNVLALKIARRLGFLPDVDANGTPYVRSANETSFGRFALLASALGATSAATVYWRPSWYYFLSFATIFVLFFRCWKTFFASRRRTSSVNLSAAPLDFFRVAFRELTPSRREFRAFGIVAVVSTSVFFTALSPWIYRNYRVVGRFVPTSLQLGASLYDGWNPTATGASDMRFVDDFRRLEAENPSDSFDVPFEVRLDERLKNAAVDWAKSNPGEVVRLAAIKFARLWSPVPREPAFSATPLKILLVVSFTPILIGGLCGFCRSFRRRDAGWSLLLPAFYVSALHSIFVSSIRYRIPVLYGFSVLTAYFFVTTALPFLRDYFKKSSTNAAR